MVKPTVNEIATRQLRPVDSLLSGSMMELAVDEDDPIHQQTDKKHGRIRDDVDFTVGSQRPSNSVGAQCYLPVSCLR